MIQWSKSVCTSDCPPVYDYCKCVLAGAFLNYHLTANLIMSVNDLENLSIFDETMILRNLTA